MAPSKWASFSLLVLILTSSFSFYAAGRLLVEDKRADKSNNKDNSHKELSEIENVFGEGFGYGNGGGVDGNSGMLIFNLPILGFGIPRLSGFPVPISAYGGGFHGEGSGSGQGWRTGGFGGEGGGSGLGWGSGGFGGGGSGGGQGWWPWGSGGLGGSGSGQGWGTGGFGGLFLSIFPKKYGNTREGEN